MFDLPLPHSRKTPSILTFGGKHFDRGGEWYQYFRTIYKLRSTQGGKTLSGKNTLQPKTQMDVLLEQQQEQVLGIAKLVELMTDSKNAILRKHWITGNAGGSKNVPFDGAKSLYVDNSLNPNDINIRLDNEVGTHLIPASCAGYVICDGARSIGVEGVGTCYILVSNIVVPPSIFPKLQPTTIVGSLTKGPDNNYFAVNNLNLELKGNATSQPPASDYPFYTYWSIDTDPHGNAIVISNGANWTVV